jgi:hypothetical protein
MLKDPLNMVITDHRLKFAEEFNCAKSIIATMQCGTSDQEMG